jgi:predicted AlkP superfamily phosphohydrolase/phosphomutase
MAIFKKSKNQRPRVCVIGLDGVPHSLLLELARREIMPFMAQLIGAGHLHRLKASLPEISAVSWTDFMTGKDSGTHGIFGFTDLKPGSYALRFPSFHDLKTETFWDALGRQGKRCFVINQPSTYPARPINGVLISGFVAVELAKGVYPRSLQAPLERMGYRVDIDTLKARDDVDFLWRELEATLTGRERALEYFWPQDWDYFEFVVTGTDRLHHFLWSALDKEDHPHHHKFLDYYRKVDELIGTIVRSFRVLTGGDKGLYLLSDHGFCGIEQEVYLNAWLEKEDFLKFSVGAPQTLEDMAPESAAFALDPSRIYLHSQGRFPKGAVSEAARKTLKREIAEKLGRLEFEGRRVIRRVCDADEVYRGPLVSSGPDLLVISEPGFDLKGSVKKKEVFGRTTLQGMHTWDDAFFWSGRPAGEDLAIRDLASLILEDYH